MNERRRLIEAARRALMEYEVIQDEDQWADDLAASVIDALGIEHLGASSGRDLGGGWFSVFASRDLTNYPDPSTPVFRIRASEPVAPTPEPPK